MKAAIRQRGAAFMVMVTVLVLGVAWFTVGALGKTATTTAEREAKTALALQAAKLALLGYVAQYAARTDHAFPGRMPCPESLNMTNPGESSPACSNSVAPIGRLPWKTLGIDETRDADGEPLWYVLSANFHPVAFPLNALPPDPYLNFLTPPALPFDGTNVVAVLIAPGRALRSNPCNAVNQQINRYASPLDPTKFFECGNATGAYANPGSNASSNDRVLAITAAEWIAAIAGPVAERLQRQVAPALEEFRSNESNASWGKQFLPNPSSFSNPTTNNLCGADGVRDGLTPSTQSATSTCTAWTGGSVTDVVGDLDFLGCNQVAGNNYQCQFRNDAAPPLTARIRAKAPNLGGAFRARITPAQITDDRGGAIVSFSLTADTADYEAELSFELTYPMIANGTTVTVTFPNLPDAAVMSDPRAAWFFNNDWGRYTYYVIGSGNRLNGSGSCTAPGDVDCLTLTGLPAANGNPDDKQFLLTLMGPALPAIPQTQPSNNVGNYLESRTTPPDQFTWGRLSSTYNDRFAACPFRFVDGNGVNQTIC